VFPDQNIYSFTNLVSESYIPHKRILQYLTSLMAYRSPDYEIIYIRHFYPNPHISFKRQFEKFAFLACYAASCVNRVMTQNCAVLIYWYFAAEA